MKPLEIADSQISCSHTAEKLVVTIPSYPYFRECFRIANQNFSSLDRDKENRLTEAFVYVMGTVMVVYLVPLITFQELISAPTLTHT